MSIIKKNTDAFLIVSRFNENVEWISKVTEDYLIYNKGNSLPGMKEKLAPNFGGNQYDIFSYIFDNYDSLPPLMAFVQGNPFDHCLEDRFYSLIKNNSFTSLFGDINYPDGRYSESNDNWYIHPTKMTKNVGCIFGSFDEYMNSIFSDYSGIDNIEFPPGSQIIVERERCTYYSKEFWYNLMNIIPKEIGINGGAEAHIIERSIQIIFENKYKEKN